MLLAHAAALAKARSVIACLADQARTIEASSAFERALIELDAIYGDEAPAFEAGRAAVDNNALMLGAVAAIQQLTQFGVDALHVELLLCSLADADALDEA